MTEAEAYELAAKWHDKLERGCREIANDEPRIEQAIRTKALAAAMHHAASATGLRNLAWQSRRRVMGISTK